MVGIAIYERIHKELKLLDMTTTQFCKECGISRAALTEWNKGRSSPKLETVKKAAEVLGVSFEYLWTGYETVTGLSEDETRLVTAYRQMSDADKSLFLQLMRARKE